ncbi:MAG: hypothetical protein WAU70_18045, partial [Flavobacteriales bacterium]
MRHWWWKVLCVLLLLYVAAVGLRTPLRPGLVSVSPSRIAPGPVAFDIVGYNTAFNADAGIWSWLENGGDTICISHLTVDDATHLRGTVDVPAGLREPMTDLKVVSFMDGDLALRDAFFTEGRGNGITAQGCGHMDASPVITGTFPNRAILNETIRNLFFHVPMWFTMIVLMGISFVFSIMHLRSGSLDHDLAASV